MHTASEYSAAEKLHQGRSATLYRAVRRSDGRSVVLKVLDSRHSQPRDRERLEHELELGRLLTGLQVVVPLALSTFEGLPALELEDFGGASLALVSGPMEIGAFLRVASKISAAVADIHARGVVHRDLEPGSILVDRDTGEVRIAEFGIASRLTREQTAARPARSIEGSLPYVSPEQTGRMNRAIDSRSDLYSLGVTFYQLLTGRLPFQADDAVGWVHCHVARTPPSPDELRPSLPRVLSEIVLKLLAKAPDDRYQSAAGLAHDLARCFDQWQRTARIVPFPLGEQDLSDRFLVPQKLYGRQTECAELRAALARVQKTGAPELVLVSGYSGIGKSAVVHELQRSIVAAHGLFVTAKFEERKRVVPYSTIVAVLRELALDVLAASEQRIAEWKTRIQDAVGPNGRLVVDLVPPIGLVIGPQPPVPELPSREAEVRLRAVLRQLIAAFAGRDRPLTVFLDDLQWADPASLALLVDLVTDPDVRHFLLIGAYRDNEVDAIHPLRRALDAIREAGARVHDVVLGPLSSEDVTRLVADMLRCSLDEASALARLVHDKTGGNPFFAIQFLTALHAQGWITFDRAGRRWRWDVSQIRAQRYTDNVADLMLLKLGGLPRETQDALRTAACLGSTESEATLATVLEREPEAVLRPALEEDLLLRVDSAYRFAHDRVQEAAYSLVPERERAALHLRIGRLLLANANADAIESRIFEIVGQLDRGATLIEPREEREQVAELNLVAGKRAQRSTAYASALAYFAAGSALLADDRWDRCYPLAFELELRRAECEHVTGALESAGERLADLSRRALSFLDAAAVARVQVLVDTTRDRPDRAVEAGLACLRRYGIEWSAHPSEREMREEYARMWTAIGDRPIEDLAALPPMRDPEHRAAMDLLAILHSPALFTDDHLNCLLLARMANISLAHGNDDASCFAYVWVGTILGSHFDDYGAGFRFGKLGLDLVESGRLLRFRARVYMCFATLVNPWARHLRTGLDLMRRAFEIALETGDYTFASYACNNLITQLLAQGHPLAEVQREADRALVFVRKARFGLVIDIITTQLRLVRALRGTTRELASFDDARSGESRFDERGFEEHLEGNPHLAIATCWYWIRKLQARFHAGDHAAAVEAAERARPLLWTSPAFFELAEYHYFAALARAARHDEVPVAERSAHLDALRAHHERLARWAESCPDNFLDRAALAAAEIARIEGRADAAARLYEDAIAAARASGFVHHEAVAFERAAAFHGARDFALIAATYLREARDRYGRWGADGKVRELERRHAELLDRSPASTGAPLAPPEQIDLLAVVKASRTISGAIVREELQRTLLGIVLEESGARRARLALIRRGELEHVAETTVDEPSAPLDPLRVPASILGYVQRTRERVLLDDASADAGRFARDPYILEARPRSVLCLPILRQAELLALLYLENDLVAGAFTAERVLTLEVLAAQAAVSLENSLLLEREHAERLAAEAAGRRSQILAEATSLMSSRLDEPGALEAVVRLCASSIADWAIIDRLSPQGIVRVAAHRDPSKEPLLRELSDRYPARVGATTPITAVLQGGATIHVPALTDEQIRGYVVDDRHAEIIGALGARSWIIAPLIARDRRLGALSLVSATPRRFGPGDVELAEELGRRAALAIDHARMLDEMQRALRLREEFLTVASHELRTPMMSLGLAVEALDRVAQRGGTIDPARMHRTVELIVRQSRKLRRLADELLDVALIEQGGLRVHRADVELGRLVREVVQSLEAEAVRAGSATSIDSPAPVPGWWDPARLEQVVTNLLSNAIKFGAGKPIEIRVRAVGDVAELAVVDHGIGIDPERQAHVFERFERAVPWVHYGGLGMGLYITRSIVAAHDGTIRVESQPGAGATFTVTLPRGAPRAGAG